jgi:O-acetyl-ADP-ribose deacetylase (regulator of RNase III)
VKPAARIAVSTSREFVKDTKRIREVIFCCFSAVDLAVYEEALRA